MSNIDQLVLSDKHITDTKIFKIPLTVNNNYFLEINDTQNNDNKCTITKFGTQTNICNINSNQVIPIKMMIDLSIIPLPFWKCLICNPDEHKLYKYANFNFNVELNTINATKQVCITPLCITRKIPFKYDLVFGDKKILYSESGFINNQLIKEIPDNDICTLREEIHISWSYDNMKLTLVIEIIIELDFNKSNISGVFMQPLSITTSEIH